MRIILHLSALVVLPFACADSTAHADPVPPHETFTIESVHVGELRTICVWTPPCYPESEIRFPVLYMPDGGINEDFPHIANTVSRLVASGAIPPLLLVGIENTQRRRDLTGPSRVAAEAAIAPLSDGASKFRMFISEELFPEIDRRYRTTASRGIIGESAAGLFVVETLMLKPELFQFYIAMDPAIYWNDRYLVRTAVDHLSAMPNTDVRFWFASSNAAEISPHAKALARELQGHAPESLQWKYADHPSEKHSTIFRATKEQALVWTYGIPPDTRSPRTPSE